MSLALVGMGNAVPEYHGDQRLALELASRMCAQNERHDRLLRAIYRRSGVSNRHSVLGEFAAGRQDIADSFEIPERGSGSRGPSTRQRMKRYTEEIPPLARRAAEQALQESGIPARQLTHLITVSCTGFYAPGFDQSLIAELGLSTTVARTHVGYMGCHGALNGLRVARAYTEADPAARVLLCAAELCTLHLYYGWDEEKVIANALFADGAAAIVGVAGPAAPPDTWNIVDNGSTGLPSTADMMSWHIGDHGFEMTLSMRVPDVIEEQLRPWAAAWLDKHDLSIDGIASWAIHPGGPRIVSSAAKALELDKDAVAASEQVLADYGNMSSPTVLFILQRLRAADAPRPCVALAFGPGLAVEAALIR